MSYLINSVNTYEESCNTLNIQDPNWAEPRKEFTIYRLISVDF